LTDKKIQCRFLGELYTIQVILDSNQKKDLMKLNDNILVCHSPNLEAVNLEKALKTFYKKQAKKFIDKRLRHFQPMIKTKYKSFKIESHDGRWGSCSSMRNLTFNWRLMMFPTEAIDYVIIHELCHLEHLNHDRSFWRLVGKLCPDYKNIMPILGTSKTRDL